MSDINVEASVVPTATEGSGKVNKPVSTGPKYNDDTTLLEEGKEEVDLEDELDKEESSEEQEDKDNESDEESDEQEESTEDESESEKPAIAFDRPSIKEIKDKYPNFFKDFPQLKEQYFREIEFTKLFPTIEDAKEAFTDNEAFTALSDSALSGDPAPILESVSKTDPKAFETFSMSFLPALFKQNNEMYSQVITPVFQNLVQTLYKDKDENTRNAALVIADWIFGKDGEDVATGKKSAAKSLVPSEEQNRLKEQKEQALTTAFRTSAGKVQSNITKSLEQLVFKSQSFDPERVFSPSLRRMGAQEIIKSIMKQLESDKEHMTVIGARWKRARANGYTSDDESKIVSTYLARAKSLIPGAASKISSAMLGTKKAAATVKSGKAIAFPKQNNSGREVRDTTASRNGHDYIKMSDLEILNS